MALEKETQNYWRESMAKLQPANNLAPGGGDGHPPGMDTEVALLKQRADQADQRMARVEDKLDRIAEFMHQMPTKTTVWTAFGTGGGIALAILGIFVAILAYLQDQRIASSSAPAPAPPAITLQLPPWPSAPTPPTAPPTPRP